MRIHEIDHMETAIIHADADLQCGHGRWDCACASCRVVKRTGMTLERLKKLAKWKDLERWRPIIGK